LSQFQKYHPSGIVKFNNLGICQSFKLHILVKKILPIPHKLNFTPNTLDCYGLRDDMFRFPVSIASLGYRQESGIGLGVEGKKMQLLKLRKGMLIYEIVTHLPAKKVIEDVPESTASSLSSSASSLPKSREVRRTFSKRHEKTSQQVNSLNIVILLFM